MNEIIDYLPGLIFIEDAPSGTIVYANQDFRTFFGAAPEPACLPVPSLIEKAIYPADRNTYQEAYLWLEGRIESGRVKAVVRCQNALGEWRWLSCIATVLKMASSGGPERVLWFCQDITDQKLREDRMKYACYHDALTGLYNRAYFEEELNRQQGSRNYPLGILMMDVDGLKDVNDQFGHSTGDQLLCRVREVLRESIRHEDVAARIGGDEFAVLLPKTTERSAWATARRLLHAVERNNATHPGEVMILSIGAAVACEGGSLRDALDLADQAMYRMKKRRKDGFIQARRFIPAGLAPCPA
jgi:diguanylate cyclase (GGDEF)-like protein/PAS domain S-box-containing protein